MAGYVPPWLFLHHALAQIGRCLGCSYEEAESQFRRAAYDGAVRARRFLAAPDDLIPAGDWRYAQFGRFGPLGERGSAITFGADDPGHPVEVSKPDIDQIWPEPPPVRGGGIVGHGAAA